MIADRRRPFFHAKTDPGARLMPNFSRPVTTEIDPSTANAGAPTAPPAGVPPTTVSLNDLQQAGTAQLLEWGEHFHLRNFPPRPRHALVTDLARAYLTNGVAVEAEGMVDQAADSPNSPAVLRWPAFNFMPCPEDASISPALVKGAGLRPGLRVRCWLRAGRGGGEKPLVLDRITSIEGVPISQWQTPTHFDQLTPLFPNQRLILETPKYPSVTGRAIDLLSTLGCGQRGLILAPPRVGKTVMLKEIARSIAVGSPDVSLILLLIDERPEEVTDFRREVQGAEIYSSTFDEPIARHAQVADLVAERAKRLVELGRPVVVLLDSLTRLARAFNNLQSGKGRIMSGGLDAKALGKPKKFFGAARNTEEGGSLTILATCLVDTGSRMDEVIFEEFKGTGNMEIHLDRSLSDKRLFPAIHVTQSGTRRDELLFHPDEFALVAALRKQLSQIPAIEAMEVLIHNIQATRTNAELLLAGLRGT